jgi:DNA modification methylase
VVCDPFSGVATTGLAALQSGRHYLGIDVNPTYHDLALGRLQPLLPTHPSNGDQP